MSETAISEVPMHPGVETRPLNSAQLESKANCFLSDILDTQSIDGNMCSILIGTLDPNHDSHGD